jgi:hypothetical protein
MDTQFIFSYMFIPNLYTFRALMCSSSGELIVSTRHLVSITPCRWPSGMQVWVPPNSTIFILYMFISNLYMFRALMCSSSGELIVSTRHLVSITLCRWPSGMQVWVPPNSTIFILYMFIPNLYMFRALMCSSSGELIVSTWHLVSITPCTGWPRSPRTPRQYTPQTQTYSEGSRKLTRISIAVPYSYHSGTVYVGRYM